MRADSAGKFPVLLVLITAIMLEQFQCLLIMHYKDCYFVNTYFLSNLFSMDSYMIFIEIVQHCLKIAYLEVEIFCETRYLIIQDIADFQLCK